MRAMNSMLISLGQTASHSPMFVQCPKPSAFMRSTMATARRSRSGWPCGSRPRCPILAAVKSDALALGHAATHAPQPMHCAASMARSAASFAMGTALPSGALPACALT